MPSFGLQFFCVAPLGLWVVSIWGHLLSARLTSHSCSQHHGHHVKTFNSWLFCFCQFAPGFQVGDGIGMDLKLSNHVFNALKQHAYSEERRSARLHEKKEHSTAVSMLSTSPTVVEKFILQTVFSGKRTKQNLMFTPTPFPEIGFPNQGYWSDVAFWHFLI